MPNLPSGQPEFLKYLRLVIGIVLVFGGFYYVSSRILDQLSTSKINEEIPDESIVVETYSGRVKFYLTSPFVNEGVRYYLEDATGKEIYLLKSNDEKLAVAEGHWVDLTGVLAKTLDGSREVLLVDKIIFSGNN